MKFWVVSSLLVAAALSQSEAPKIVSLAAQPRAKILKILGKPRTSTVHQQYGVVDIYKLPGYPDVRFDYVGSGAGLRPFSARFTFQGPESLAQALALAGVNRRNTTERRSPSDGSLLIEHVSQLPAGWKISYWSTTQKPHQAHLDFESPAHA